MRVSTLSAVNFKGRNFSFQLGDVSLVIADNFTWKSSVPMALRLGLAGYLPPPIGKSNGSIFKLAGGQEGPGEMSVTLGMDNGRTVRQRWIKDVDGKVSSEGGVAADLVMPELLMEPRLFFAKTGAERVKAIFDACDMRDSGFGPEVIRKRLVSVSENPAAVCEATLDGIEKMVATEFDGAKTLQKAADSLLARLNELRKQSAAMAKQASGAFAAFRTKVQGDRPKDVAAALADAKLALEALIGRRQGANRAFLEQRLREAKHEMEEITRLCGDPSVPLGDFLTAGNFLTDKARKVAGDLEKLGAIEPYDASDEIEDLTGDYTSGSAELEELEREIVKADAQLSVVEAFKLCKKCEAKIVAPAKKRMAELTKARGVMVLAKETVRAKIAELEAKQQEHQNREATREALKGEKERIESLCGRWTKAAGDWESAKNLLDASENGDTDVEAQIAKAREGIADLERQDAAHQQYRRDLMRRDELERELLESQCRAAVYKAVVGIVTEEQAKASEWAFNKVLGVAECFTSGLLNSKLEFVDGDLGRRVSKLDIARGSTAPLNSWISHETFSGTEQALAYLGFSVALCQSAPVKVVIVDDVIIAPDRKRAMAARFVDLVKQGVIDQAIIVDVGTEDYLADKRLENALTVITIK